MSQKLNNGALLALLAAGALTVAGSAANRRRGRPMLTGSMNRHSSREGSCSHCGVKIKGSMAVKDSRLEGLGSPPEWASTTLFFSRVADRQGFLVPYDVSREIATEARKDECKAAAGEEFDQLMNDSLPQLIKALQFYFQATTAGTDEYLARRGSMSQHQGISIPALKQQVLSIQGQRSFDELLNEVVISISSEADTEKAKADYQREVVKRGNQIFARSPLGKKSLDLYNIAKDDYQLWSTSFQEASEKGQRGELLSRDAMRLIFYGEYKASASTKWVKFTGSNPTEEDRKQMLKARRLNGFTLPGNGSLADLREAGTQMGRMGIEVKRANPNKISELQTSFVYCVVDYMRSLYTKRVWCLEVLKALSNKGVAAATQRSQRRVIFSEREMRTGPALYEDTVFKLALPGYRDKARSMRECEKTLTGKFSAEVKGLVVSQVDAPVNEELSTKEDKREGVQKIESGSPTLHLYSQRGRRMTMWWLTKNATLQFELGRSDVPLLTETSKMGSPSFSLPAYTAATGGTCPAASFADTRLTALAGIRGRDTVICKTCYALTSGYAYANVMTDAAARKQWVNSWAGRGGPGAEVGGQLLALMLASYSLYSTGGDRKYQEIGIKKEGRITYRSRNKLVPMTATRLNIKNYKKTARSEARENPEDINGLPLIKKAREGKIAGFFRLHDSGDLFSPEYTNAWFHAAKMMPNVYIWIPTRVWASKKPGELKGFAATWHRAWMDGRRADSLQRFWTVRGLKWAKGSKNRQLLRQTPKSRLSARARMVLDLPLAQGQEAESVPGELSLLDWYADETCDEKVLPSYLRTNGTVSLRPLFQSLVQLSMLPNVAVRPSAIYIKEYPDDPVTIPNLPGMSAGTGVARKYNPEAVVALNDLKRVVDQKRRAFARLKNIGSLEGVIRTARGQALADAQALLRASKTVSGRKAYFDTPLSNAMRDFRSKDKKREKKNLQYPEVGMDPSFRNDPIYDALDSKVRTRTEDRPAQLAYQCPVYTLQEVDGKLKEAKSCHEANCRACWVLRDLPIFYGAH